MSEHLTCREVADFILEYLEGDLDPAQRAAFEEHMAMCPPCITYIDTYRTTVDMEHDAFHCGGDEEPAADVPQGLIDAILRARSKTDS